MKNLCTLFIILLLASCDSKEGFNSKSIQLNSEATEKMKTEDYVYALKLLNESIKLDSTYYVAYNNKISVLAHLNRYDEAIKTNKLLLIHKPDFAEGQFFLGMLYDIKGDTIRATQSYKVAIQLYKDRIKQGDTNKANELNLAFAYKFAGKESEANNLFDKLKSDPKYKETVELIYNQSKENLLAQLFETNK